MRFLVDEAEGPINYHLRPQRNGEGVCHWCSYQILTSYLISVYMNRRAETWKTRNLTALCTKETKSSTNDVICVCRLTDHEEEPINCENNMNWNGLFILTMCDVYKQLLDEVFVISGIIKVEVSVVSRSQRVRLITLTETLIILDITKTESNNCFIIHCFEKNNDKGIRLRCFPELTVGF